MGIPEKSREIVRPDARTSLETRPVVAIVIPAFNEEANIEKVLTRLTALQESQPAFKFVPIVVNDGSSDRTEEVLRALAPRYGARFVTLPLNLGIGRAVQTGFQVAHQIGARVVLQFDGDGQHPADAIPRLVAPILAGEVDVVVGSRYVDGAGGNVSSGMRQIGTYFFSFLLKALVGLRLKDTTSGFRAFSADACEFLSRYYPDDYPEVTAYVPLVRSSFRVREIPVTMLRREGGQSSITPIRSLYYMIKVAFATFMDVFRKLPKRRKSPPGGPGHGG